MPIAFEFVVSGAPVSQQTRRRALLRKWIQTVRRVARRWWGREPPRAGAVAVKVSYFYDGDPLDVDNIPKPVLDALKGIVYDDDRQVFDLLCRKRQLGEELLIHNPSAAMLDSVRDGQPFLHISVAEAMTREIVS